MTDFEKHVLSVTATIPVGEVRTYKWVAQQVGRPKAWRAVANALHKNPYPLFIPCHRVVKTGNQPGGYALGADLKKELLEFEKKITKGIKGERRERNQRESQRVRESE